MGHKAKIWISGLLALTIACTAFAQEIDEERMRRDVEVAENVLATLIKQEFEQQRTFFGLDVSGSYYPGYGVTFRIPPDHAMPFVISITGDEIRGTTVISEDNRIRYSYSTNGVPVPPTAETPADTGNSLSLGDKAREKEQSRADSNRSDYNDRIIRAAQNFIIDYGDFISQLKPDERIVVTNQSDQVHFYFNPGKRSRITVEGTRADVSAFREGKLSREQVLKRLTVVNTETVDKVEPDLEMLSSIFTRLYRPDLSKTYFTGGNIYYERLANFGAVFYMRVMSSDQTRPGFFAMPTVGIGNLDQATRDKKVTELYPIFEQDVKDNIVEYGRTVKSLGDNESLIFNIILTQCRGCGIPSTLELSIKASVLKEFAAGKINKATAVSKISTKKGQGQ